MLQTLHLCFLIIFSLFICSCAQELDKEISYGKTTRDRLIQFKGKPLKIEKVPDFEAEVLHFDKDEKFQVAQSVVTHGFRNPMGDEVIVLFWLHKFKNCNSIKERINEPIGDQKPEYRLTCPEEGISVIYTEGSEFVSRIVEHEKI